MIHNECNYAFMQKIIINQIIGNEHQNSSIIKHANLTDQFKNMLHTIVTATYSLFMYVYNFCKLQKLMK